MEVKNNKEFKKDYNKLMFAYSSNGTERSDLPDCDNRILCLGSNVCLGNEPYSCERMCELPQPKSMILEVAS